MVRKRPFGRTGRDVSEIGFGAWAIGGLGYGDVPQEDALGAVEAYLECGGRAIDTARGYGVSEILVGKALKRAGLGEEVFVASKSSSSLPAIIRTDCETSRFCLGRDCIDLYYVHVPPAEPDKLDPILDAYQDLKAGGRIGLVGVSQCGDAGPDSLAACRRYIADGRVDVVQLVYSLGRQAHADLFAEAQARGVALVGRMVLEGGLLTGKYRPGHVWPDRQNDWRAQRDRAKMDPLLGKVQDLAARFVRTPYESLGQLAIAFALAAEGLSSVLVGGKTAAQVRENLAVADLAPMDAALRQELADACRQWAPLFSRA